MNRFIERQRLQFDMKSVLTRASCFLNRSAVNYERVASRTTKEIIYTKIFNKKSLNWGLNILYTVRMKQKADKYCTRTYGIFIHNAESTKHINTNGSRPWLMTRE